MSSSPGTASPLRLSKINSNTSGTNRSESILLMLLLNFIISLCGMACLYVSAICSNGSYVKHEDGSSIKWSGDLRYSRWIQNRKCDFSWPTSSTLHDSSWAEKERERERGKHSEQGLREECIKMTHTRERDWRSMPILTPSLAFFLYDRLLFFKILKFFAPMRFLYPHTRISFMFNCL